MAKSVITTKLRRCPFCGGRAEVIACDLECIFVGGENDGVTSEGVHYGISHPSKDNASCVVATTDRLFQVVGGWLFDTPEEAAAAWNQRAGND